MRIPFPLGLGSYETPSLPVSDQRCINLYGVVNVAKSLDETALYGTAGIVNFSTAGTSVSRGGFMMLDVYYVVTGTTLYSISELGVATDLGTIAGEKRCVFAHNGEKLVIVVPGGKTYEYNSTPDTLVDTTAAANFQTSDSVVYFDSYFVFTASDGIQFFNSNLSKRSSSDLVFDALDFGEAEISNDLIVAIHTNYDEILVLGEVTTEIFQNVGGSGFPFQRVDGANFEKGCHGKYTPIQWEGSFYFIGGGVNEKSSVWQAGNTAEPIRVSTDAIDNQIQKFTREEISNSFSFSYSIDGYAFIGFTIRSVNIESRTFVFNFTASQHVGRYIWHEQQTGVDTNAWRVESVTSVYNKLLVSDSEDGRIGYLSEDIYTEYGNTLIREKTTPPLSNQGEQLFISEIEITAETGTGLITGQGQDPIIMMQWSEDGARTWTSEINRKLGKIGEYLHRVVWRRLGRIPFNVVFRFRISDPVKVVLIKLEVEAT